MSVKRFTWCLFLAIASMGILMAGFSEAAAENVHEWVSENHHFRGSYSTEPLEINRLYSWVVHVEDSDGNPVENASIELAGGMPAHDHGLPTSPQMTEYLGDGNYKVEGLRFHMMGAWELTMDIAADDISDTVLLSLQL